MYGEQFLDARHGLRGSLSSGTCRELQGCHVGVTTPGWVTCSLYSAARPNVPQLERLLFLFLELSPVGRELTSRFHSGHSIFANS